MRDAGRQHPRVGGKRPLIVAEVQVDGLLVGVVHLLVRALLLHEEHRATQLQKLVVLVQAQFVETFRHQFHASLFPDRTTAEPTGTSAGSTVATFLLMGLLYRAYSREAATLHRSLPTIIRGCLGKNFDLLDFRPNDCKTLPDRPFPEYSTIRHFFSRLLRSSLRGRRAAAGNV